MHGDLFIYLFFTMFEWTKKILGGKKKICRIFFLKNFRRTRKKLSHVKQREFKGSIIYRVNFF